MSIMQRIWTLIWTIHLLMLAQRTVIVVVTSPSFRIMMLMSSLLLAAHQKVIYYSFAFSSCLCILKKFSILESDEEDETINQINSYFGDSVELENDYDITNDYCDLKQYIYDGSHLNLNEFLIIFMWLCNKLQLNRTTRGVLLEFIHNLLPSGNKIPQSYHQLLKLKKIKKPERKHLCTTCYKEIDINDLNQHQCFLNSSCKTDLVLKPKHVEVIEFNIAEQLSLIVKKEWKTIKNYQSIY